MESTQKSLAKQVKISNPVTPKLTARGLAIEESGANREPNQMGIDMGLVLTAWNLFGAKDPARLL